MTTDQLDELKAIQDAYLEMATKRQEAVKEPLEEAVGGFGSHYSKSEKEKEMADDHKDEKETSYRSKSPKRSGFSALDRLKAKQGIKEEEVSADRKIGKDGRKVPARRIVDKDSKDYVREEEVVESERSEKYKTIVSSLDRMRAKAIANAELQKLQKQNKDHKKLPEEVESLEEEKIPVNHAHDAVGSVLGQSAAVKFATNLKAGTAKHTTWKDINKTLVKQGEQTHHIAKIAAKLKPAQYNEEIEELDEVSMATLDSYRKKAFDEPGFKRQAGRALAYDKSGSHGDSKVKSSEEIANAKSQIKTLIKPEHHSKYPIHKITSHTSARKIYKDASAAGHLIEEVEELDELSKKTLGSYVKKAADSVQANTRQANTGDDYDLKHKSLLKTNKRISGIGSAVRKLTKEEVELEEAKKEPMEVYHTGYSAALQHAEKHLNKQGYDIHPNDWQEHISHGPSKPSEGKTVQLHVPLHKDGVKSKKVAHIQVYNRGNTIPKNNELNMYVN